MTALASLIRDTCLAVVKAVVDSCHGIVRRFHRPILIEGVDAGSDAFICPRCSTEWPCKPFLATVEDS